MVMQCNVCEGRGMGWLLTRYITFLDLQLKNCLGWGRFIGTFCLRVVLSAKYLVINKGHIIHA
jgi:hypothetical protein